MRCIRVLLSPPVHLVLITGDLLSKAFGWHRIQLWKPLDLLSLSLLDFCPNQKENGAHLLGLT